MTSSVQIQLAGQELFQFDPAHNIIEQEQQKIADNQVTDSQSITYLYNAKDKLIETVIQKPKLKNQQGQLKENLAIFRYNI